MPAVMPALALRSSKRRFPTTGTGKKRGDVGPSCKVAIIFLFLVLFRAKLQVLSHKLEDEKHRDRPRVGIAQGALAQCFSFAGPGDHLPGILHALLRYGDQSLERLT